MTEQEMVRRLELWIYDLLPEAEKPEYDPNNEREEETREDQ